MACVPGHGPLGEGQAALENFIAYLRHVRDRVGAAIAAGRSLEETLATSEAPPLLHLPANMPPNPEFAHLIWHLHRLNVLATYHALAVRCP